jgi:hypothetical protein
MKLVVRKSPGERSHENDWARYGLFLASSHKRFALHLPKHDALIGGRVCPYAGRVFCNTSRNRFHHSGRKTRHLAYPKIRRSIALSPTRNIPGNTMNARRSGRWRSPLPPQTGTIFKLMTISVSPCGSMDRRHAEHCARVLRTQSPRSDHTNGTRSLRAFG